MNWLRNIVSDVGAAHSVKQSAPTRRRREVEKDYEAWLARYYPKAVSKPMAFYHRELWEWIWQIELDQPHPEGDDAFFGIWPRRGGKTTSGQLAVAALGARKKRHYGWLLSRTQPQANQKLLTIRQAIGKMGSEYLRDYPHMAKARTEDGQNLGWNTQRLICSDGGDTDFIVEAIGLDMAVRGANIEFQRPDFIMPDDIDKLHDSPYMVEKNIETLTQSILLAGTNDKVVLGLQNLIHRDSIFAQIADGRAKFLMSRIVSGPYPALEGDFKYEERETLKGPRYFIISGTPTWPEGLGVEVCEKEINDAGPDAFELECQHNVTKAHINATFNFDPVYHVITQSEMMRMMVGRRAIGDNLEPLPRTIFDANAQATRFILPRGECAMAHDWGSTPGHPCGLRWMFRPGERNPLSDTVFFIREACFPTFPPIVPLSNDPRAFPSYGMVHDYILKVEKSLGIKSTHDRNHLSIEYRLNSHERPEAGYAYMRDFDERLMFDQIDTKEAKEGILHLQEFMRIDRSQFHPFRIDPRTLADVEKHDCKICGWRHRGRHLQGRPRALWVVADGQGELKVNRSGKLEVAPAINEFGLIRTRWEYPRHRARETAEGEEKDAAKKDDEMIDCDRALMGRVFYMIKYLSSEERLNLRYREIREELEGVSYPDPTAHYYAMMSADRHYEEEREKLQDEGKSWIQRLDGWNE